MSQLIGKKVTRIEDARLLTGQGKYIDDIGTPPNTAHVAILRSPYPHAKIVSIDYSEALEIPGVKGVVTGKDIEPLLNPFSVGVTAPVQYYPMAIDKVRYVGEPVAVVAAKNRYIAEDVLEKSTLGTMPLYHTMGMRSLLSIMFLNGKYVVLPDFDEKEALELLEREEITSLMIMRARRIPADEGYQWGLITKVVPKADLEKEVDELVEELFKFSPLALKVCKQVLNAADETALSTGIELEGKAYGLLRTTEDFKEGVAAFVEKRKPNFVGK